MISKNQIISLNANKSHILHVSEIETISLKTKIQRSQDYIKKQLGTHYINVGLVCSHGCKYCITPMIFKTNPIFNNILKLSSDEAFKLGIGIVDPNISNKIYSDCEKLNLTDMIIIDPFIDAWSPEAQIYNLGRNCLKTLIMHSDAKIRILTKNVAITKDYDIISKYSDRIELSLSITAPPSKAYLAEILEPNVSPISERINALKLAHDMGIRVYGMLCPCIPGIIDTLQDFEDLLNTVLPFNPTNIWAEPVKRRGDNLLRCVDELIFKNEPTAAEAIDWIRYQENYDKYVNKFIDLAIKASMNMNCLNLLRILINNKPHGRYANHPSIIWLE